VAQILKGKLTKELKKFKKDINGRNQQQIRYSIYITHGYRKQRAKEKARDFFLSFLSQRSAIACVIDGVREVSHCITKIQIGYRLHSDCIQRRRYVLDEVIWDRAIDLMTTTLIRETKSVPKYQKYVLKINTIPSPIK
jgi:hypothetical protein